MAWQTPIADRTESDVIARSEKGTYNAIDLNRVGECVQILADTLNLYGYSNIVDVKTNWQMSDVPTTTQMQTYLDNIDALIEASHELKEAPLLPDTMQYLNWRKANNIERILIELKKFIERIVASFRYCGTFRTGEKTLPQYHHLAAGSAVCSQLTECGEARCGNYIIRSEIDG